jgi:hypothetical protein
MASSLRNSQWKTRRPLPPPCYPLRPPPPLSRRPRAPTTLATTRTPTTTGASTAAAAATKEAPSPTASVPPRAVTNSWPAPSSLPPAVVLGRASTTCGWAPSRCGRGGPDHRAPHPGPSIAGPVGTTAPLRPTLRYPTPSIIVSNGSTLLVTVPGSIELLLLFILIMSLCRHRLLRILSLFANLLSIIIAPLRPYRLFCEGSCLSEKDHQVQ